MPATSRAMPAVTNRRPSALVWRPARIDTAPHRPRSLVDALLELTVEARVEGQKTRAHIASPLRVRSCKSPPCDHSRGNAPLNPGKRAAPHQATRERALTSSSVETECPNLTSSDPR